MLFSKYVLLYLDTYIANEKFTLQFSGLGALAFSHPQPP